MPDGHRRSRTGWADAMEAGPPSPPAHTHRLPPLVRYAIVGLTGAMFCLLVAVSLLSVYVYQQQQYVQGKGEQRDRENARLEEQQRQGICDLLDQLPEGGLLERPRTKYGCGPGIPLDELTPQEQEQVAGRNPAAVAPPVAPSPQPSTPPLGSGAVLDPPRPSENPPPQRPEPSPLVDLGPVADQVCDGLGVCG